MTACTDGLTASPCSCCHCVEENRAQSAWLNAYYILSDADPWPDDYDFAAHDNKPLQRRAQAAANARVFADIDASLRRARAAFLTDGWTLLP